MRRSPIGHNRELGFFLQYCMPPHCLSLTHCQLELKRTVFYLLQLCSSLQDYIVHILSGIWITQEHVDAKGRKTNKIVTFTDKSTVGKSGIKN